MQQNSNINPAWMPGVPSQQMPLIDTLNIMTQIQQVQQLLQQNMMRTQPNTAAFNISTMMPPPPIPVLPSVPHNQAFQTGPVMAFNTPPPPIKPNTLPPPIKPNTLPTPNNVNRIQEKVANDEKVFVGKVTKLHGKFGLVDNNIFFQFSCVRGPMPLLNDTVYVKAKCLPDTPFQWNATLVQLKKFQMDDTHASSSWTSSTVNVNANKNDEFNNSSRIAPPNRKDENDLVSTRSETVTDFASSRKKTQSSHSTISSDIRKRLHAMAQEHRQDRLRERQRERSQDHQRTGRTSRKRQRNRSRERIEREHTKPPEPTHDKSMKRSCEKSPASGHDKSAGYSNGNSRNRPREYAKKNSQEQALKSTQEYSQLDEPLRDCTVIPKFTLNTFNADVPTLQRRYPDMLIPLDLFHIELEWMDTFPPEAPFTLSNKSSSFHIMHEDIKSPFENDAVLNPPDADYSFSAKVILISLPTLENLYDKTCGFNEKDKQRHVHPTRLINFLVGLNGEDELMSIGGPWSPSIDGLDPYNDPSVLIRTAIRTCKALTGIDLSKCTEWYRFMELYYRRQETGAAEAVTIFVPSVWQCAPTQYEYRNLKEECQNPAAETRQLRQPVTSEQSEQVTGELRLGLVAESENYQQALLDSIIQHEQQNFEEMNAPDSKDHLVTTEKFGYVKNRVSRWSTGVNKLENNAQPVAKVDNIIDDDCILIEDDESDLEDNKIDLTVEEPGCSKDQYTLPIDTNDIIVHPSRNALSGKFDCAVKTLSSLLDYSSKDASEHTFEVLLLVKLFNETLARDFGMNIYKALLKFQKYSSIQKIGPTVETTDIKSKAKDKIDGMKIEPSTPISVSGGPSQERITTAQIVAETRYDKHLLLSFQYFDTAHSGMITEPNIRQLLSVLGLRLSQTQITKLLANTLQDTDTRPALCYRALITSSLANKEPLNYVDCKEEDANLLLGNRKLLAMLESYSDVGNGNDSEQPSTDAGGMQGQPEDCVKPQGLVNYKGRMINMESLTMQLKFNDEMWHKMQHRLLALTKGRPGLEDVNTNHYLSIRKYAEKLKEILTNRQCKLMSAQRELHRLKRNMKEILRLSVSWEQEDHEVDNDKTQLAKEYSLQILHNGNSEPPCEMHEEKPTFGEMRKTDNQCSK